MDGENNGKPYFLMDDLGGNPIIFGNIHMIIYDLNSKTSSNLGIFLWALPTQGMDWLSAPAEIGDPNYQALFGHKKGIVTKLMLAAGWNMLNVRICWTMYLYIHIWIYIDMLEYEEKNATYFLILDMYSQISHSKCIPFFRGWPTLLTLVKVDQLKFGLAPTKMGFWASSLTRQDSWTWVVLTARNQKLGIKWRGLGLGIWQS